jgi:hypothetical protein
MIYSFEVLLPNLNEFVGDSNGNDAELEPVRSYRYEGMRIAREVIEETAP